MTGLDVTPEDMEKLFEIKPEAWKTEMEGIEEFFKKFGERLPVSLWAEHEALGRRLEELGDSKS